MVSNFCVLKLGRKERRRPDGARIIRLSPKLGVSLPSCSHSKSVRVVLERRASAMALAPTSEMLLRPRLWKIEIQHHGVKEKGDMIFRKTVETQDSEKRETHIQLFISVARQRREEERLGKRGESTWVPESSGSLFSFPFLLSLTLNM